VGLAHDLILADGADRRIARPLVSKCSIGGNFRAPCDGGVSVQVSVIPRAREVRFVRLLRAESHPARCSGLLWLRLRSAQRMPTSVHLLCGFAGMTAALERRHRLAVGGLVIDDQPLSFGATFHGVTE
jgi:hypothetical protein